VIGWVVVTVILLVGLVIALVALLRLRPSWRTQPAASERVDPTAVEREVYEKLYGKRVTAVSAAAPHKPSPGAQADVPRGEKPSGKQRSQTVRRPREHPV
jgi:hypothetical protein